MRKFIWFHMVFRSDRSIKAMSKVLLSLILTGRVQSRRSDVSSSFLQCGHVGGDPATLLIIRGHFKQASDHRPQLRKVDWVKLVSSSCTTVVFWCPNDQLHNYIYKSTTTTTDNHFTGLPSFSSLCKYPQITKTVTVHFLKTSSYNAMQIQGNLVPAIPKCFLWENFGMGTCLTCSYYRKTDSLNKKTEVIQTAQHIAEFVNYNTISTATFGHNFRSRT